MKRKDYQKPMMEVIECEQEVQLLQASGQVRATVNSTWEEDNSLNE